MTVALLIAIASSNSSSSTRAASFENTLKLTPPSRTVAPSGALAPDLRRPALMLFVRWERSSGRCRRRGSARGSSSCRNPQGPFQSSGLSSGTSAAGRQIRRNKAVFCPQPKTTAERIGVVAGARARRQRGELFYVASPEHRLIGLQRRDESL